MTLDGHSFPLAADYTVPIAVMLASTRPEEVGTRATAATRRNTLRTARIVRLQPYDPNKTVVLVIHGLMDSAATWTPMINDLRGDEEIRRNYQFWFYSYPSGYPYPYSAAILRRELDAIEKNYPMRKPMVVIGHSMGGCISRLLDHRHRRKLWLRTIRQTARADTAFAAERASCSPTHSFSSIAAEVGRVIFISAPLRGSEIASGWLGRIGSRLVKAPVNLLSAGDDRRTEARSPLKVTTCASNAFRTASIRSRQTTAS